MPTSHEQLRDELLAGPHVGILGVTAPAGSPPLVTPVWYVHDSGQILLVTGRRSRKAALLRDSGEATFLVHDPALPRHVGLDTDVELADVDDVVRHRIAERYVPPDLLDGYLQATADADAVLVRLRPRRWRTVDLTQPPA